MGTCSSWLRGLGCSEKGAEVDLLRSSSKQALCKLGSTEEQFVASIERVKNAFANTENLYCDFMLSTKTFSVVSFFYPLQSRPQRGVALIEEERTTQM